MINRIVNTYSDFFKNYKKQNLRYNFFKNIIIKYCKKGNLLDVGCAKGYFLKYICDNFDCFGLELDKSACDFAKKLNQNCIIKNIDAKLLSKNFKPHYFDVVTIFDVLEHIDDPNIVIKEVKKVIKKDGIIVISVPNLNSLGHKLKGNNWFGYRDKTHVSLFSESKWLDLFSKNNLKLLDKFYEGYFDIPYYSKFKFIQKLFLIPGILLYITGIKLISTNGENIAFILKGQ